MKSILFCFSFVVAVVAFVVVVVVVVVVVAVVTAAAVVFVVAFAVVVAAVVAVVVVVVAVVVTVVVVCISCALFFCVSAHTYYSYQLFNIGVFLMLYFLQEAQLNAVKYLPPGYDCTPTKVHTHTLSDHHKHCSVTEIVARIVKCVVLVMSCCFGSACLLCVYGSFEESFREGGFHTVVHLLGLH